MSDNLAGTTVIITGAGSGIGRATALRVARDGATVACVDVAGDACAGTAKEIAADGGRAAPFVTDVSDPQAVTRTVEEVSSTLGRPNALANIAGIGTFVHTTEETLEEWDRIIAVNLTGTFLMCRAVLPHLLEQGGVIVNTASTAALMGQPYSAAYCASKGGVLQLTKALAAEYVERGVRINAVAPGGIDTPLIASFGYPEGSSLKLFDKMISPLGFAQPDEVANVFAFLLDSRTRYMTGSVVVIDGGMTA